MPIGRSTISLGVTKSVLATIVEIVVFLFAAFGSHLTLAAPPVSRVGGLDPKFATGIASFAALLVFLLAKFWIHELSGRGNRRAWASLSVAITVGYITAALSYGDLINRHSFRSSAALDAHVELAGTDLTGSGKEYRDAFIMTEKREPTEVELLRYVGNDPTRIPTLWTPASILSVHERLLERYVAMVVLLASAIAGLIELLLARAPATGRGGNPPEEAGDGEAQDADVDEQENQAVAGTPVSLPAGASPVAAMSPPVTDDAQRAHEMAVT